MRAARAVRSLFVTRPIKSFICGVVVSVAAAVVDAGEFKRRRRQRQRQRHIGLMMKNGVYFIVIALLAAE